MTFGKQEEDKHLGLRIDSELHYISKYCGRSANGQVVYLIRKAIEDFESERGSIEPPDEIWRKGAETVDAFCSKARR